TLHGRDAAIEEMEVGAADGRRFHSYDGIAGIQELRVGYRLNLHLTCATPTDGFHIAYPSNSGAPQSSPATATRLPVGSSELLSLHNLFEFAESSLQFVLNPGPQEPGDRCPRPTGRGIVFQRQRD